MFLTSVATIDHMSMVAITFAVLGGAIWFRGRVHRPFNVVQDCPISCGRNKNPPPFNPSKTLGRPLAEVPGEVS